MRVIETTFWSGVLLLAIIVLELFCLLMLPLFILLKLLGGDEWLLEDEGVEGLWRD